MVREALPDEAWPGPVEALDGGALNQVCRVRGARRTVVFKCAPPHVASQPDTPLSATRLGFEAEALRRFRDDPVFRDLASPARPPALVHHDARRNFLLMEDLEGALPLDRALAEGRAPSDAGARLGACIGALHRASAGRQDLARAFDNRPVQRTRFDVQYAAAARWAEAAGAAADQLPAIDANAVALGERLLGPGRCWIMGDLWPPSILCRDRALHAIDWEFAHFGQPLQDRAHFLAHCRMHAIAAGDAEVAGRFRRCGRDFDRAYREALGESDLDPDADRRDTRVHFGAEILMRVLGPFSGSGPFASMGANDPRARRAAREAIALLADPDAPDRLPG